MNLTASQLELYSSMKGAEEAARIISEGMTLVVENLQLPVSQEKVRGLVHKHLIPVMKSVQEFGCFDTEAEWAITDHLSEAIGIKLDRYGIFF